MTISYCTAAALCTIHKLIQRAVLKMIQFLVDVIIKIPLCSCFFISDHIACGMMRVGVMMGVCVFLHAYACMLCCSFNQSINLLKAKGPIGHLHRSKIHNIKYINTQIHILLVYIRFLVPVPTIAWKNTCPLRLPIFMLKESKKRLQVLHTLSLHYKKIENR